MPNLILQQKIEQLLAASLNRRKFLTSVAATSVITTLPFSGCRKSEKSYNAFSFSPEQQRTLAAVLEHLLPHETDSPGASDLNSLQYLEMTLNQKDFDPEIRDFIEDGLKQLMRFISEKNLVPFEKLDETKREYILLEIQSLSWGESWTSLILNYLLEALLGDPIYGGNIDEAGWKWLDHTPGQPRPTQETRFGKNQEI